MDDVGADAYLKKTDNYYTTEAESDVKKNESVYSSARVDDNRTVSEIEENLAYSEANNSKSGVAALVRGSSAQTEAAQYDETV